MSNRDEIIEAMARGICESRLWPGAWNSRTDFEGERRALIEDAAAALAAFEAVVLSRNHNELIARLRSPTFGTETSVAAADALEDVTAIAKAARRACEWYAEENAALRSRLTETKEALRPFAVTDPSWENQPDHLEIELCGDDTQPQPCITLGDFRRANAALSDAPAPKGQSDD